MTSFKNREYRQRQPFAAIALGCATIAAALFAAAPAMVEVIDYIRFSAAPGVTFIGRWALVVLWFSVLQCAYGAFLILWPDWAAVWSLTISLLAHAAINALSLGIILVGGSGAVLVTDIGLQWTGNGSAGKAALWCLCMVSLWTLVAFFAGRLALSWRRAEVLARQTLRHST